MNEMIKMVSTARGAGFLHTPRASYNLQESTLSVWPEDVEEVQARGWSVATPANQPQEPRITTVAERTAAMESLHRSMWRRLEHPEQRNRLVPMKGARQTMTCDGRVYTIPEDEGFIDVPREDVRFLVCNCQWLDFGPVGPTEGRPVNPPAMTTYIDLTVGCMLLFDGQDWRYPVTGEAY